MSHPYNTIQYNKSRKFGPTIQVKEQFFDNWRRRTIQGSVWRSVPQTTKSERHAGLRETDISNVWKRTTRIATVVKSIIRNSRNNVPNGGWSISLVSGRKKSYAWNWKRKVSCIVTRKPRLDGLSSYIDAICICQNLVLGQFYPLSNGKTWHIITIESANRFFDLITRKLRGWILWVTYYIGFYWCICWTTNKAWSRLIFVTIFLLRNLCVFLFEILSAHWLQGCNRHYVLPLDKK